MSLLGAIDDYQSGAMPDAEAEKLEEALFDGAAAEELAFVDRLARLAAWLVDRGTFYIGHTRKQVEELVRSHNCALIDCGTGGPVHVKVARSAEIVISKLTVDLRDVEHIEVETYVEGHGLVKMMRDIHFDAGDGELYAVCEAPLAHLSFGHGRPVRSKVIAIRGEERRVLAESEVVVEFVD